MEVFEPIPLYGLSADKALHAVRLNCLGSLFYFTKIALRRKKLTEKLHLPFCRSLEDQYLKDLIEMPRDHFKSTCAGEGLPMWRVLPFTQRDAEAFNDLAFPNEFIRHMYNMHRPDLRNLLVSENITNSSKLGSKIRRHYESNGTYRTLFPETLPTSKEIWTTYSLHLNVPGSGSDPHGEGTFDFVGVGGALQSRHYNGLIIQDDLVGRKAIESLSIMEKTWEYHQLLPGCFEGEDDMHEAPELVIGNRWGYHDLNTRIREFEDWFRIQTHSALGGCCSLHPADTPIFPELFHQDKLDKLRRRFGNYFFSCQFLNNPSAPENADFNKDWLNFYVIERDKLGDRYIRHEVKDGVVKKDLPVSHLAIEVITDPCHSTNAARGRARHAIIVLGQSQEGNYYLLETWAETCNFDRYFGKLYEIAQRWGRRRVGFETIAAQKFAAYHITFRNNITNTGWPLRIVELKGEVETPDGEVSKKKIWRIRTVLGPIFEFGRFWAQRKQRSFLEEYETFPKGRFLDQLDAAAYAPQMLRTPYNATALKNFKKLNRQLSRKIGSPYCAQGNYNA